jgi:arsenate reductase (thioredoxin)
VCIGNACRSPMAEAFANHYGRDVLIASSAGLSPIPQIPPETVLVMQELNIDASKHIPRRYDPIEAMTYDLVVNMSGFRLPGPPPRNVIEWSVADPFRASLDVYRASRSNLEQRVMRLILNLRKRAAKTA